MDKKPEVKVVYRKLQERLDKNPVGAPAAPEFFEILELMFTEEHARVASRMPLKPTTLGKLAARTGVAEDRLRGLLGEMAGRGLVIDLPDRSSDKTYYVLNPPIIGFLEFSLMRERDDIPQKRLAELMGEYVFNNKEFAKEAFRERTQLGRTLVHETALDDETLGGVLDSERASRIIEEAEMVGVALCYCRHKARLLGHPCGKPEEICMLIGYGADYLVRNGFGRETSKAEMLDLLEVARENGLVHTADNVLNNPTFICNCCGCCCGLLGAINKHGLTHAIHTSNFIAQIDVEDCKGCGKCEESCPIGAISILEEAGGDGGKKKWAVVDESICLGCGVCHRACAFDAVWMKERAQRVLTPESTLERILTMAVERGKLHHFMFDEGGGPSAKFLKTFVGAFLRLPQSKRLLLNREVKSRFLDFVTRSGPDV